MKGIERLEQWRRKRKGRWYSATSTDGFASEGFTITLNYYGDAVKCAEEEFAEERAGGPDDTWIGFDALAAIAIKRAEKELT